MRQEKEAFSKKDLSVLLDNRAYDELARKLVLNSKLPGPAANLTLVNASAAPFGSPEEFLPVCALVALGALYPYTGGPDGRKIIECLKRNSRDGRWRCREASAMAFQRIGERDFEKLREIVSTWLPAAGLLERRCIMAALAHPPFLNAPERVRFCLETAGTILNGLPVLPDEDRKTEAFRVLRKGLEYCLSVFIAHGPEDGFPFLEQRLRQRDPCISRILFINMGKARLAKKHGALIKKLLEKYSHS